MKKTIYRLSFAIFLIPRLALAGEYYFYDILDHVNNSFTAVFNGMMLDYRENVSGVPATYPNVESFQKFKNAKDVKDSGIAYGVLASFRRIFHKFVYFDLGGEFLTGKIKYEGYLLGTKELKSLTQKGHHNFANADIKLGIVPFKNRYFQIIPYGVFGYHHWWRGDDFAYSHFKIMGGAKIDVALFDEFAFSPYFNFGKTLMPRALSDKSRHPECGDIVHKLGSKVIKEFGLEMNYRWDNEIYLTGIASYTQFEYGMSKITCGSVEPGSKTNEIRLGIGVKFGFNTDK